MSSPVWVIVLSGASCSGKTTLARALTRRLSTPRRPFLNVEADRLLPHLPLSELRAPQVSAMSRALHRATAAFAAEGFDLIVDGVLPYGRPDDVADALEVFGRFRVCRVGVRCDVSVLEERERMRPDRERGWARRQAGDLHLGQQYDVMVDTSLTAPEVCAEEIALRLFALDPDLGS